MHRPLLTSLLVLAACALLLPLASPGDCHERSEGLSPTPAAGDTIVSPIDGATMVYVPAGEFLMGNPDVVGFADEQPQRTVYLDAYYIDRTEVTVQQYRKFCAATGRKMRAEPPWKWQADHPINVTWRDASAYAAWAGKTLPTEAQWEKAARGTDGRNYPWGGLATADDPTNGWDATKCANESNSRAAEDKWGPHAVGSFPAGASPYGCLDMAGNVWEWCADRYGTYDAAQTRNPKGAATGRSRVVRGGSWLDDNPEFFRCAFRYWGNPSYRYNDNGFRCVVRPPVP